MKNNSLDDIIKCNVEISNPASNDATFDSILLVVPGPEADGTKTMEKTTVITKADELLDYGFTTAVMRAFLSVPGHMFFAVMMGYYYSRWHILTKARKGEEWLSENGYIKIKRGGFDYKRERNLSLLVPILFHGTYNFCCAVERAWALIAFLVFVVFMYVHCFKKLKQISREDATNDAYVVALLMQKYPGLPAALKAREEVTEFK